MSDKDQAENCEQTKPVGVERALEAERIKFEKWITAPPYEREVCRKPNNPDITAWPGNYHDYNVQLAWEAWAAAKGF